MLPIFFTKEEIYDIQDDGGNVIGNDIVTYYFNKILDPKNLEFANTYSVRVKHRCTIRAIEWNSRNNFQEDGFLNYPVLLNIKSGISQISDPQSKVVVRRVFPKTINASIEQTSNESTGSSKSQMNQTSSGSSLSNVNTFGIGISAGFFGELPVGSISLDYSHSWDHATSQSRSASVGSSNSFHNASGYEMSVKDWSAYASIRDNSQDLGSEFLYEFVEWNWGQTNPWNIFKYNQSGSEDNIVLPDNVVASILYSEKTDDTNIKNILMPPSDLSLFGLDFTMAAEWLIRFPDQLKSVEGIKFLHQVTVQHGSHRMLTSNTEESGAKLNVTLGSQFTNNLIPDNNEELRIGEYSLIPLKHSTSSSAIVGFREHLFDIKPEDSNSIFKIISANNDLLVKGNGFGKIMSASFPKDYAGEGAELSIAFKVTDVDRPYSLNLFHWKEEGSGDLLLQCTINEKWTEFITVDDLEGKGATNNLSTLELRNLNVRSINFHDYLKLGYNQIKINIMPKDKSIESIYNISALSVED